MSSPASTSPKATADQNEHQFAAARERLARLENFVRSDPGNVALLIDAFETALSCHDWERALFHLRHGKALETDPWGWRLREGDYWLAQGRFAEATDVLRSLSDSVGSPPGFKETVLHNLAFVDFRQGNFAGCADRLAPLLCTPDGAARPVSPAPVEAAMQMLWLRALHHDLQLDRAMDWARSADQAGLLHSGAAGVASLVAIDASDIRAAQRWSARSLEEAREAPPVPEALVTQASLALGMRDEKRARHFAGGALQLMPDDGRSLSVLGFADLLAGNLPQASVTFTRALEAMPSHIGTWHGSAWTHLLAKDLPGARQHFEQALSLDRNFAESHGGLAVVLAMQGEQTAARTHAEFALRLDPTNVSGRYAQAILSGQVKDARDLQRVAKRLLAGVRDPSGEDLGNLF